MQDLGREGNKLSPGIAWKQALLLSPKVSPVYHEQEKGMEIGKEGE